MPLVSLECIISGLSETRRPLRSQPRLEISLRDEGPWEHSSTDLEIRVGRDPAKGNPSAYPGVLHVGEGWRQAVSRGRS